MKISRKKLKELILEIVDGHGKEILDMPDKFETFEEMYNWIENASKGSRVGGVGNPMPLVPSMRYDPNDKSFKHPKISAFYLEFERIFQFGDPERSDDKISDKWNNAEYRKKYPRDPLQNLSDEKVNWYNEFGKRAKELYDRKGISPGKHWKIPNAEERKRAKERRLQRRRLKRKKG